MWWEEGPRPLLMGIVNVTPDSFSDGGRHGTTERAVAHALALLDEGAHLIDVGGESTRPGAAPVDAQREQARVVPVVRGIVHARPGAVVSVDTSKPEVARAALEAGACIVNDVAGLGAPGMLEVCASLAQGVVVMHMRGSPRTMQVDTHYDDLVGEVLAYLEARIEAAVAAGIPRDRIAVDPGLGFGKSFEGNLALIAGVPRLARLGPVLVGASRKGFVGALTGVVEASERVHGSVGAALAATARGATLLRVHDVAATRQALAVYQAVVEA